MLEKLIEEAEAAWWDAGNGSSESSFWAGYIDALQWTVSGRDPTRYYTAGHREGTWVRQQLEARNA